MSDGKTAAINNNNNRLTGKKKVSFVGTLTVGRGEINGHCEINLSPMRGREKKKHNYFVSTLKLMDNLLRRE